MAERGEKKGNLLVIRKRRGEGSPNAECKGGLSSSSSKKGKEGKPARPQKEGGKKGTYLFRHDKDAAGKKKGSDPAAKKKKEKKKRLSRSATDREGARQADPAQRKKKGGGKKGGGFGGGGGGGGGLFGVKSLQPTSLCKGRIKKGTPAPCRERGRGRLLLVLFLEGGVILSLIR